MEIDFWGNEVKKEPPKKGYCQLFKAKNNYRKAIDSSRCKNCINLIVFDYHDKRYYKCKELGSSNSEATDIRLSNVCNLFTWNIMFEVKGG